LTANQGNDGRKETPRQGDSVDQGEVKKEEQKRKQEDSRDDFSK